jgi:hypothetical protein
MPGFGTSTSSTTPTSLNASARTVKLPAGS